MNLPRSFNRCVPSWHKLHKALTICVLVALLAGLIPPPLVRSALPQPAAELIEAALPQPATAQAAPAPAPAVAPAAAPGQRMNAAPLAQSVIGSSVLTITKMISGTGSGPFDLTITGPSGYLTTTQINGGQTKVLPGLANGIYTVTETSPGVGWTTVYTATPGTGGSTNALVTLQNTFAPTTFGPTAITGRVYNDNNSDGNITANGTINDTGVQGVTVTIYDNAGNSVATVTDANGLYTVTPSFSGPYRVEFTNLPFGYEPSRVSTGTQNGTSTQFVTSAAQATGVNLGIARPDGYLTSALNVATTSHIAGNPSGAGAPSTDVAHLFSANASGTAAPTQLATNIQIGSVWGLAWQRSTNRLYTSAMVKRHAGLGSLGLGGIYLISNPQGTPSVSTFVDLESAPFNINLGSLGSNSARGLPTTPTTASQDATAFGAVGKQGLGDIDLTEDEQYLYAVDLYNRALLRMNVANGVTPTSVQSYALGNELTGAPSCTDGVLRPWGLRFFNGRGYLGAVCTGENNSQTTGTEQTAAQADLVAYVLSFDPNAPGALTNELAIPLTYTKGQAMAGTYYYVNSRWWAWTDTYIHGLWITNDHTTAAGTFGFPAQMSRPAPILADIDFSANGNMVLGFRDRGGDMMGSGNAPPDTTSYLVDYRLGGDVLCAAMVAGAWQIESSGSCGGVAGSRTATTIVSGAPNPPEFYDDDILASISTGQAHRETSQGGLAARTDVNELLLTVMDPTALWTGGVRALNSQTGANLRNYRIYLGRNINFGGSSDANGRFGKVGGMGDMELLYALAPTEIGNRVWNDINGNGIQDPGEPGINGITVSRQGPTNTVTTVTSVDGNYYFNVKANTAYTITITPPAGYGLTTANAQALAGVSVTSNHAISDTRDSDATMAGNVARILYTTGSAGQNNHGLDFGFTQPAKGKVDILNIAPPVAPASLGNRVWQDLNANGLQDSGEPGIAGVTVGLYDSNGNAVQCIQTGRYSNYADAFNNGVSNGSTGTLAWGTTWSFAGLAAAFTTQGNPGGSMYVYGATSATATRPVDLSIFGSLPTLSFDYIRGNGTSSVNVQYSSDGGTSYTTLATLNVSNASYQTITYTLPITVANARIRIQGATGGGAILAYFDNFKVQGQLRYPVTTVTDANGLYTFNDVNCVQPNTNYQVKIDTSQPALALHLTSQNAGGVTSNDPIADDSDSDAANVTINDTVYASINALSPATGANESYDFGFTAGAGAIIIRKATTPAGSSQTFNFTSNIPGYASFTLSDGDSYTMTNVPVGTYAVTETLPSGWTQAANTCMNGNGVSSGSGAIQVTQNSTTTCSLLNMLQTTTSNVLTVTKAVNWNENTPNAGQTFAINITGPSFPGGKADTITAGQTKVYTDVVAGVYTVTETSPGVGWVTTYSVPSGVVNVNLPAAVAPTTAGPISGKVYQDINSNGQFNSGGTVNDVGLSGITVAAYDPNGVQVGTATTDASGNYSFTPTKPGPYRVELQSVPSGYYPTTHGTQNGTSTQFVTTNSGASNVNFGVLAPCDYCQNNARFATVIQHTGDTRTSTLDALVTDDFATGTSKQVLTQYSATGTLWGLAYDRTRQTLYSGAYLKTHLGLQENMGATNPLGAIYQTNAATGATSLFVDISTLGANVGTIPSNATRGVNTQPSLDTQAFTKTMKVGLGDIDISQDDKTLYAMSLNDKTLYAISIATKQLTGQYSLAGLGNCTGGAFRPFAIGIKGDKVYVGGVCDAEVSRNSNDLQAQVYLLTGNSFAPALTIPLNYVKGANDTRATCSNKWYPWITNMTQVTCFYPGGAYVTQASPALVDINFDVDGAMILGFRDRTGDQFATNNLAPNNTVKDVIVGGDLLKACWSGTAYVLENNGQCGGVTTSGANNHQGPGGGEFYAGDTSQTYNQENSQGGAALLSGSNQSAVATMDPVATFSGGVTWYSNTSGAGTHDATYYLAGLSKGNGIGDLELLCDPAPLEIGNRVWKDLNGNGVQDGGELGVANVTVSLQSPTNTVTTNTDGNGNYYFTVRPNTAYTITVNLSQAPLNGLSLTQANAQAVSGNASSNDAILDTRDSDAVTVSGKATIYYTTGSAGQNNHGLDFGFTQPATGQVDILNIAPPADMVSLGNRVWLDTNNNGLQDSGEPGIADVTVELYDANGAPALCAQPNPANLALNQTATQASLFGAGYEASKAVDGNTTSGTSLTASAANTWWQVDLGQSAVLHQVVIYARPGGTGHAQSEQIYVLVSNQPFASTNLATLADPNVWHSTLQGAWTGTSLTVSVPSYTGRYVRIQHNNTDYLALGEVEVYGDTQQPVTTSTAANGEYYFTSADCVEPSVIYQVRIGDGQSPLNGLTLTTQDAGGVTTNDPAGDDSDSDAASVGSTAIITAPSPASGTNYSYDFGYVPVEIGNYVWIDNNRDGLQDGSDTPISGVKVELLDQSGNPVMCVEPGVYETYRDEFVASADNNSDGTLDWSNQSWVKTFTSIWTTNGNPDGSMPIIGTTAYYSTRAVDLSVFVAAPTLSFDYNMHGVASQFNIQYSVNGGANFTTLATLSDNYNGYKTITYTLPSTATVATAQIRIRGVSGSVAVYFDNVTIRGQVKVAQSDVTDANGQYTFTAVDCVEPSTTYQIRIADNQPALKGLYLTAQNAGNVTTNDPTGDDSDSDAATATISGAQYSLIAAATAPVAGLNYSYDFGYLSRRPTLQITKEILGSNITATFPITLYGQDGSVTPTSVTPGIVTELENLPAGVYTVTEGTMPAAPDGYAWGQPSYSPNNGVVTLQNGQVTQVKITNLLVQRTASTASLVLTKRVVGSSQTDYEIILTGPSYPSGQSINIISGTNTITNLIPGLYTVTETSPGAGWVMTYTVGSVNSTNNAVITVTNAITAALVAPGQITGTVFADFGEDGNYSVGDRGVQGVIATAYDRYGAAVGSTVTNNRGVFSFTPTAAGPWRLEFTNLPAGYEPSRIYTGSQNGSGTQFVNSLPIPGGLYFAINNPADYSQSNPSIVTPLHINGGTNTIAPANALVKFDYNASGSTPAWTTMATKSQIGTTWGLAYARSSKMLYAASFLKRHAGLGPNGLGAIYAINTNGGAPTLFADLATLGVNVGSVLSNNARGLSNPTLPSNDPTVFDQIGKVGLGDIDISDDERTLYVVNLNDNTLYVLNVPEGTLAGSYAIPDPGCTGGAWRPFALKFKQGDLYVGGVCDAQSSQNRANLIATIYRFTPGANTFTQVLNFPLNYTKGPATGPSGSLAFSGWYPWLSTFDLSLIDTSVQAGIIAVYPQPMLSDIEFDVDGSLILGFTDRFGHQGGDQNYGTSGTTLYDALIGGDILRACPNAAGNWVLESAGACGGVTGGGANGQGPGGGEFYDGERFVTASYETAMGALALKPGSGEVALTVMDPLAYITGGVSWFNNTTGAANRKYQIYGPTRGVYFGKANGIGDLELLLDPAPIEIGSRVWHDVNGNGVQDPGEPGLVNVTVALQSPTSTVTSNTDANGLYHFTVSPQTTYTLTINPSQAALSGRSLTLANMQAISGNPSSNDAILDTRDSDAYLVNGLATIYYTTGGPGQNNHGLNFGFTQPASGQVDILNVAPNLKVSIGNLVWEDGNDNGLYDVGEDLIDNLSMELWVDLDNDGIAEPLGDDGSTPLSTTVTVNGIYSFTELLPGAYFVRIPSPPPVTPLSSIPSDAPDNGVDNDDNGSQPAGPNTQILSPVINLAAGEEPGQGGGGNDDMTVDFGLVDPFIGNLVWYDKNNNGAVDADEPGIPGVTVQVFYDANDNGTIEPGETTPFRTTTTDEDGIYVFPDLIPSSNYQVVIPQSNFVAGGALALYRYSSDNTDTNDNQQDEDDNGVQASPGLTTTAPLVRLTVDEEAIDGGAETGRGNDLDNGDDNNGDMTVDFGFYSMGSIQIVKQATGGDDTFTFSSADGNLDGLSLTTSGGVANSAVITKMVGAYTLSETLPADWSLIGISVSGDSDNGSSKDLANGAIALDLDANEQIVVTFKNIKGELPTGSSVLTITKSVVGDPGAITQYAIAIDGSTGYYTETTVTPGVPMVLSGLAAGIYTVTETSPGAGWVMTYTVDAVTSNTNGVVDLTNALNVTPVTAGPISGKVFRDFNSDGLITANGSITDTGVSGVTVTAYDATGNAVGSAVTAANGAYTINPSADGPYRIEFTTLPTDYEPTTHGNQNGTSTQFVTSAGGASNVNMGINRPCDYCQSNPVLSIPLWLNGSGVGQNTLSTDYALATFAYDNPTRQNVVTAEQIGTVWGMAYQRTTKHLFASAILRRHAGLGPRGMDGIYVIDQATNTLLGGLDLEGVTAANGGTITLGSVTRSNVSGAIASNATGDTQLPSDSAQPSVDLDAFTKVGTVGYGDIDMAPDDQTLWIVNLKDRTLIAIDTTQITIGASNPNTIASSAVRQYRILSNAGPSAAPLITGAPTCSSGSLRPWGVKLLATRGYLGVVCDAATSSTKAKPSQLVAYVLSFDLANPTAFVTEITVPMNYTREYAYQANNTTSLLSAEWQRWASSWNDWNTGSYGFVSAPQPILADIEFADDGAMILGFADRGAWMAGNVNYKAIGYGQSGARSSIYHIAAGDVLRAPKVGNGWGAAESGDADPGKPSTVPNPISNFFTNDSAGNAGEFFYSDYWVNKNGTGADGHFETMEGALALWPGRQEVVANTYDATDFWQQGVRWLSTTSGNRRTNFMLNSTAYGEPDRFGKGAGLGDLELLCDPAPIEIGNRVWDDIDGDGVQDPGEPGLNGITVSLQGPTNTVTINTSGDGNYNFTVRPNTDYTITVAAPSGYHLTLSNAASVDDLSASSNHAISDTRDSDAILVGAIGTIHYTTGSVGQNNHGLDFGFTQPVNGQVDIVNEAPSAPKLSLGNRVWYDTNNDGSVSAGEQNVPNGVVVELYQDSDSSGSFSAGDSRVASTVTSGGYYTFTDLTPSSSDTTRYLVIISDTNFLVGGILYSYYNSSGQITNNSRATDDNKDHGAVSGTLGQTGGVVASSAISLTAGTQPTGEGNEGNEPIQTGNDANSNQTIDFGFYTLSVGNRVWIDDGGGNSVNADNGQLDSGESGLDGVTVELLDSNNAAIRTTTTSSGGYYTFTGLISGTYSVRISGYPATYRSSTDAVNAAAPTGADDDDNGPGVATGTLTSAPFTLLPGSTSNGHSANNTTGVTSNPRIDFGLYEPLAAFVLDKRLVSPASGMAAVGDAVVYDLVITNTGGVTLTTVTLVDSYDAAYLQYNSASTAPTAQATGVLTWTLTSPTVPLPLSAGETMTVTVTFTAVKP